MSRSYAMSEYRLYKWLLLRLQVRVYFHLHLPSSPLGLLHFFVMSVHNLNAMFLPSGIPLAVRSTYMSVWDTGTNASGPLLSTTFWSSVGPLPSVPFKAAVLILETRRR